MSLHLPSISYLITGIGFYAPILMWLIKKDSMPYVDVHGKNATNYIITYTIWMIIGIVLLCAFGIGLLILIPWGIVVIVFPIIAGIKANNGEIWKYPLTYEFIK